jgi:hypothetical protein
MTGTDVRGGSILSHEPCAAVRSALADAGACPQECLVSLAVPVRPAGRPPGQARPQAARVAEGQGAGSHHRPPGGCGEADQSDLSRSRASLSFSSRNIATSGAAPSGWNT